MKVLRTVRFIIALCVCLIVLVFVATPQMHLIILWDKIRVHDRTVRRDRMSRWYLWWATAEWTMFSALMRIGTDLDLPDAGEKPLPAIVIANHRSSIDVLLVPVVLHRMGYRKLTAVVKREIAWFPVAGRASKEIHAAFVARGKDPKDLERIRDCAIQAREEGACVVIFPEGTVLECGTRKGDYKEVLVPKAGGLRVIRHVLPDWPVLSLTIDWGDITGASSIYSAWTMVGGRIRIEGRYLDDARVRPLEEWLTEDWDRKERLLADAATARLLLKIRNARARRH